MKKATLAVRKSRSASRVSLAGKSTKPLVSVRSRGAPILAESIRNSNMPYDQTDGSRIFKMIYVTKGRLNEEECTQRVWRQIETEKLTLKVHHDFKLWKNEKGVIDSISVEVRPYHNPLGGKAEPLEKEATRKDFTLFLEPNNEISPGNIPPQVSDEELAIVMDWLRATDRSSINPGLRKGKFFIMSRSMLEESDMVTIAYT